jgi:WhiB family redox-sensing transcriptional regulator
MWAGLCRRVDPELFFPPSGNSAAGRRAKQVCAACQVQQRCKQWALDRPEEHGIWGGTTKRERRQLRKQQKETA